MLLGLLLTLFILRVFFKNILQQTYAAGTNILVYREGN